VVGFGVMTIAVNECHILDIAIDPAFQGKGFGKQLVGFLLNEARKKHAQMIYLEVRASNYKAQELYMKMGFNEIGIRKDYYPTHKNREDAIILGLQLDI
jgi:ribosomal-protein-alanine N-acetyltransferase